MKKPKTFCSMSKITILTSQDVDIFECHRHNSVGKTIVESAVFGIILKTAGWSILMKPQRDQPTVFQLRPNKPAVEFPEDPDNMLLAIHRYSEDRRKCTNVWIHKYPHLRTHALC